MTRHKVTVTFDIEYEKRLRRELKSAILASGGENISFSRFIENTLRKIIQ